MPLCYAVVVAASNTTRRVRQKRAEKGASPRTELRARISAANVVVQSIPYVTALTEANGTPIPEGEQVGSGQAWILTNGTMVKATWTRPSLTAVATYKDSAGNPLLLTPGQTWIELLPNNLTPSFTP